MKQQSEMKILEYNPENVIKKQIKDNDNLHSQLNQPLQILMQQQQHILAFLLPKSKHLFSKNCFLVFSFYIPGNMLTFFRGSKKQIMRNEVFMKIWKVHVVFVDELMIKFYAFHIIWLVLLWSFPICVFVVHIVILFPYGKNHFKNFLMNTN